MAQTTAERTAAYKRRNKDKALKASRLAVRKRRGISENESRIADILNILQDGHCEICDTKGRMCADHDHVTGRVRGVICVGCNLGIGMLGDSIAGLLRAVEYLKR